MSIFLPSMKVLGDFFKKKIGLKGLCPLKVTYRPVCKIQKRHITWANITPNNFADNYQ